MAESTPPVSSSFQGNFIQLKKKLISASGNSIVIRKGTDANTIREMQIFPKSKIRFLLPIGENNGEKSFFLAISSKRIALFQLKMDSPIAIFKFDEQIVDHGLVKVLTMGTKNDEDGAEFRVRLIIPLSFCSGTLRNMRLTVSFLESSVIKQKMKCLEELIMDDEELQICVDLENNKVFGFYEDTVVTSDGTVTRAGEPSSKKNKRIAIAARELWHGNILLATENGSIRVVRVKDGASEESESLSIFSEGQCVPPYCTLRCRQPSVIISTENYVIVGTQRGEVHCLNDRLELIRIVETEEGPIRCLKIDEFDSDFLLVGFESGDLRRIKWMSHEDSETAVETAPIQEEERRSMSESAVKKPKRSIPWRFVPKILNHPSQTWLMCLEKNCSYKTRDSREFFSHLAIVHRTTPTLAGIVLLCQCGKETINHEHYKECVSPNYTVVRRDYFGPARTYADKDMFAKCPVCEERPSTLYGFANHLHVKHGQSLMKIGRYLKCGVCGDAVYTRVEGAAHSKKCMSRFFTLRVVDECEPRLKKGEGVKMTPQCTLCEAFPASTGGYAQHLYKKHKTTLEKIGCYLKCSVCAAECFGGKESARHSSMCQGGIFKLLKFGV